MRRLSVALALCAAFAAEAEADFSVTVDAGRLRVDAATPLPFVDNTSPSNGGSLLLLIGSGNDATFTNDIAPGTFAAGDDVVLAAGGFNNSGGSDETITFFYVSTNTTPVAVGERIALRWFPQTTFQQYKNGATPSGTQPYGTYSPRTSDPVDATDNPDGGDPWLVPPGGAIQLNFFTSDTDLGGTQSPSEGYSQFVVSDPSPPPTPTPPVSPTPTASPAPSVPPSPSPLPSASPSPGTSPSPTVSPSPSTSPSPTPASHLANISTRLRVGIGDDVLIAGFILQGTGEKRLILRGIGPSLTLPGRLMDPVLELYDNEGTQLAMNDRWQDDLNRAEVEESTLAPTDPNEPALLRRLPATDTGFYTAIVSGKNGTTGNAVVEVYDLDQNGPVQIVNIATRGFVRTEDDVMIGGLIVTGDNPADVVIRAIGPSLTLDNKMADPVLELFDNNGNSIAHNDDWKDDQQGAIEASGLAPRNDRESAVRITFSAGSSGAANYTGIVRGKNGGTGVGLIEVYKLSR